MIRKGPEMRPLTTLGKVFRMTADEETQGHPTKGADVGFPILDRNLLVPSFRQKHSVSRLLQSGYCLRTWSGYKRDERR